MRSSERARGPCLMLPHQLPHQRPRHRVQRQGARRERVWAHRRLVPAGPCMSLRPRAQQAWPDARPATVTQSEGRAAAHAVPTAVHTDLPGADPLGHQAGEEDEVQDGVLPAGAAHAMPQDVQGRDPLLQRHDLRGRRQGSPPPPRELGRAGSVSADVLSCRNVYLAGTSLCSLAFRPFIGKLTRESPAAV